MRRAARRPGSGLPSCRRRGPRAPVLPLSPEPCPLALFPTPLRDYSPAPRQLTIQVISPVEKRVDFELPWTEVAPRLDRAYNELRREVRLRGFRPGKAPRPVLEKLYRGNVEDDVARELVELSLGQAIKEKQIEPVAPPRVDRVELKSGQPFKFSARVEVRSQVEPKDYTGIPVERRVAKVSDEQLNEALEGYRRQLTNYVSVEGRETSATSDV